MTGADEDEVDESAPAPKSKPAMSWGRAIAESVRDLVGYAGTFAFIILVVILVIWAGVWLQQQYRGHFGTELQKSDYQKLVANRAARELEEETNRLKREQEMKAIKMRLQREKWEQECESQGLHFKGTIGGQVECRP